jgi:plastocyanin
VEGVLVYVDGGEALPSRELLQREVTITSHEKQFEPHVEAVPVGKSVTFPNLDDIMHNVFSISEGNRFDLGLYKSGAKKDFVFENPGLVRIYCNIHPHMSALVQVLPNPYYAWAKPDGSFSIAGVPPGQYSLTVWHEEGEATQPIIVSETGASGVVLKLDVSNYKKRSHLNKFGKPYKRKRGKY